MQPSTPSKPSHISRMRTGSAQRGGAMSAMSGRKRPTNESDIDTKNRPTTHSGALMPSSPDRKTRKMFSTLSPRQISLKLAVDGEYSAASSSNQPLTPAQLSGKGGVRVGTAAAGDERARSVGERSSFESKGGSSQIVESIEKEFSNAEVLEVPLSPEPVLPATGSTWPKIQLGGQFARLSKPSESLKGNYDKSVNGALSMQAAVGATAGSPVYPSLGYRLNAAIHTTNTGMTTAAVGGGKGGGSMRTSQTAHAQKQHHHFHHSINNDNDNNNNNNNLLGSGGGGGGFTAQRRNAHVASAAAAGNTLTASALPSRHDVYHAQVRSHNKDKLLQQVQQHITTPQLPPYGGGYHADHDDDDDHSNDGSHVLSQEDISYASTVFHDMDMDDVLDYLLAARDEGSKNAPFVHVTPRHNLEFVPRSNFYDLVMLERPGNPKTGLVWVPRSVQHQQQHQLQQHRAHMQARSNYNSTAATTTAAVDGISSGASEDDASFHPVLPATQVMQLSLYGVLVTYESVDPAAEKKSNIMPSDNSNNNVSGGGIDNNAGAASGTGNQQNHQQQHRQDPTDHHQHHHHYYRANHHGHHSLQPQHVEAPEPTSELIPLRDFMLQRSQVDFLRTGRFFGLFKELKVFTAWKHHTRACSFANAKRQLLRTSFFSDNELISCLLKVSSAMYDIECDIHLFAFHGRGIICISDYIEKQIHHNQTIKVMLRTAVTVLCDSLQEDYDHFANGEKLAKQEQAIKDHHPLKDKFHDEEQLNKNPDLLHLRSIMRLKDEFREKLKRIFMLIQFKMDETVAGLIERFWLRFKQFIMGIKQVNKSIRYREESYWTLDRSMFTEDGYLLPSVLHSYNTIDLMPQTAGENSNHASNSDASKSENGAHTSALSQAIYGRGNEKGVRVEEEWLERGSHVCIDINLCVGKKVMEVDDFMNLHTIDEMKVMILPGKISVADQVHALCGDLGDLINTLPKPQQHPLVMTDAERSLKGLESLSNKNQDVDLDMGDLTHHSSSAYFTTMVMHPIYNSTGGYHLAIDALRFLQQAYAEASGLDSHLFKLFEIVRKLWSLSPSLLAKQAERSLVLPKIKDYVENPDAVDDLKRSQDRDHGRMQAFKGAAEYLHKITEIIAGFQDIKHQHGLVASFRPIVQQIQCYRSIQSYILFSRLPVSFNTRCSVFYDYVRKLEQSFGVDIANSFDAMIHMMRRLKNFETVKDVFDSEFDICDNMFVTIDSYNKEKEAESEAEEHETVADGDLSKLKQKRLKREVDAKIAKLFHSRTGGGGGSGGGGGRGLALTTDKLFRIFVEALERLGTCMNKARSMILGEISQIKNDTLARRQGLHNRITTITEKLQAYDLTSVEYSPAEVSQFLTDCGREVETLHTVVDDTVATQLILLEAHDIVGAANAVLRAAEVDKFAAMDVLERIYQIRCKAWACIVDATTIKRQLLSSKLVNRQVASLSDMYVRTKDAYEYLQARVDEKDLLDQIKALMVELKPIVEISSYLSSTTLRPRHWKWMGLHAFVHCGLRFRFSGRSDEFITVYDFAVGPDREPIGLGNINRLDICELMNRGASHELDKICSITSEAVIEQSMESVLDTVENSMKSFCVMASGEWLRDPRLREKIYLELNQVVNITQLNMMAKYCMKSVLIVENTSQDMSLTTFDGRIEKIKQLVAQLEKFIVQLGESQRQWFYLLHFIKFSARGEVDRDSIRLFNNCTEDLKKIEMALQQRSDNLLQAFASSANEDLNTEALKSNLNFIMDDAHSSVQSMLDACPRLSLISYNRVVVLMKAWMLGAHLSIAFVSECFHDLFTGVGTLNMTLHVAQRLYMCAGFVSHDGVEVIAFAEPVPFTLALDEFIDRFNTQTRMVIESGCDMMVLHRIHCMQALLVDTRADAIVDSIGSVFQQRTAQLTAMFSDMYANESFLLINSVSFAEDVWTSLGHPTGCLIIARDDLSIEHAIFARSWRESLTVQMNDCKDNIANMQQQIIDAQQVSGDSAMHTKIKPEKRKALLSSMLLLEITFLRCIEELLACKGLESATELWAGRYQLRFEYDKTQRHKNSPIHVVLGSIMVPHGLEYFGGHLRVVPSLELESALQKVLSSAFAMRGSVFISYDDMHSLFEVPGEFSLTSADIAAAIGRISTTIADVSNRQAVHFFLARMVYLDAVGSVDFLNIDHAGLQVLINSMMHFWNAIESKSDQQIQEAMRFPLKSKFSRNDLQAERRKNNLHALRQNINDLKKSNRYIGPIVIGMASETYYTQASVFDHFYRNIFNPVSLPHKHPINNLGLLLTAEGFIYGMDLQATLKEGIQRLADSADKHYRASAPSSTNNSSNNGNHSNDSNLSQQQQQENNQVDVLQKLCTSLEIHRLVTLSAKSLRLYQVSRRVIVPSRVGRFKVELECFCAILWERVLLFAQEGFLLDLVHLRDGLFTPFYKRLEMISTPEEIIAFDAAIGSNQVSSNSQLTRALVRAAGQNGLVSHNDVIANCGLLWQLLTSSGSGSGSGVVVVTGPAGVGKTALRQVVVSTMRAVGVGHEPFFSESWPVQCRRAGDKILKYMRQWCDELMDERDEQERLAEEEALYADLNSNDNSNQSKPGGDERSAQGGAAPSGGIIAAGANAATTIAFADESEENGKIKDPATSPSAQQTTGSSFKGSRSDSKKQRLSNSSKNSNSGKSALKNNKGGSVKRSPVIIEKQEVHVSVIYHASLPAAQLLGHFEGGAGGGGGSSASSSGAGAAGGSGQARWLDGILVRKLRSIDEQRARNFNRTSSSSSSNNKANEVGRVGGGYIGDDYDADAVPDPIHIIVLNGPIGAYIEQLFSAPFFLSSGTPVMPSGAAAVSQSSSFSSSATTTIPLLFPSGELHSLHTDTVKVLIETNDISHASPACFAMIPMLRVHSSGTMTMKRLLTVWMRSVMHWLGDFPPWLDFLEFLSNLLFKTQFVEDLLTDDYGPDEITVVTVVTRISSFLRLLEDLLAQVQAMAIVDATFSQVDTRLYDDNSGSSSSGDDSSSSDEDDNHRTSLLSSSAKFAGGNKRGVGGGKGGRGNPAVAKLQKELSFHVALPSGLDDGRPMLRGCMSLGVKKRELLLNRARLCVAYAAIWGFGATSNGTDRRKFFDNAVRDAINHYVDEDMEISLDCSVFECTLDLAHCALIPAVQRDSSTGLELSNPGVPKKFESLHIYAELLASSTVGFGGAQQQQLDRLVFRSPSLRAVESCLRRLLSTGANVLVFGARGCGKTMLITDVLRDLSSNLTTPQAMRATVNENLVDIVNGRKKSEGIFAVLEILKYIMSKFASTELREDAENSNKFDELWQTAGEGLKLLWSENAQKNCENKTVSSSSTSLRAIATASDLRNWMDREFATETPTVLETPRFSYGLAFVDDVHFCDQQHQHALEASGPTAMRLLENRPEALLKGLVDGTPLFNVRRHVAVRSAVTLGLHEGSKDGAFDSNPVPMPTLHQELPSDLRLQSMQFSDDFVLQRMGLISATTGTYKDFETSSCFGEFLPSFCMLSVPSMQAMDLHSCFVSGAMVCMRAGIASSSSSDKYGGVGGTIVDVLKAEIVELTKFTMNMCAKLISPSDNQITCALERAIRSLVIVDISLVGRFCTSLRFGCSNVTNPGGLIQLYAHEWKRYFLDPLPDGAQRDRVVGLLCEELNGIDEKSWSISADWLKVLQSDFAAHKDRVWTDAQLFTTIGRDGSNLIINHHHHHHADASDSDSNATVAVEEYAGTVGQQQQQDHPDSGKEDSGTGSYRSSIDEEKGDESNPTTTSVANHLQIETTSHALTSSDKSRLSSVFEPATAVTREQRRLLYLPVELDRAGTERSLYSGTWDMTQLSFRQLQSAEEIAQGKIDKVLDFTSSIGAGDVRHVLYPAAISLVLRMVRILSVAGKHVLLAGYFGSSRTTALHLAARICNLSPVTFEVKSAASAGPSRGSSTIETLPSEWANYSQDFVLFLKSAVYKTAGFRPILPSAAGSSSSSVGGMKNESGNNSSSDHNEQSSSGTGTGTGTAAGVAAGGMGSASNTAAASASATSSTSSTSSTGVAGLAYELIPPQRLLVAIQSCQQLSERDRRILLNLIDYQDMSTLFEDHEILAMAQVMRVQLKKHLIDHDLYSEGADVVESQQQMDPEGGDATSSALASPTSTIGSATPRISKISGKYTGSSRSLDTAGTAAAGATVAGDATSNEISNDGSSNGDNNNNNNNNNNSGGSGGGGSAAKFRTLFSGYAFHWVKQHLSHAIRTNLSVVIDVDIPRSMKIDTTGAAVNAAAVLKKMTYQTLRVRATNKTSSTSGTSGTSGNSSSSSSNNNNNNNNNKSSNSSNMNARNSAFMQRRASQVSIRSRFSLQLNNAPGASSGGGDDNNTNTEGIGMMFDPSKQENILQLDASAGVESNILGGGGSSSPSHSAIPGGVKSPNKSYLQAHGIFTCPILGPMLNRRFYMLWYDIDGCDAAHGICTMLMKNERVSVRCTGGAGDCSSADMYAKFKHAAVSSGGSDVKSISPKAAAAGHNTSGAVSATTTSSSSHALAVSSSLYQCYYVRPYSPITLSLRTSNIGVYIPPSSSSSSSGDGMDVSAASISSRGSQKQVKLAQQKAQQEDEARRRQFRSTTVLTRYNFHLHHIHPAENAALRQLSVLSQLGVFRSFGGGSGGGNGYGVGTGGSVGSGGMSRKPIVSSGGSGSNSVGAATATAVDGNGASAAADASMSIQTATATAQTKISPCVVHNMNSSTFLARTLLEPEKEAKIESSIAAFVEEARAILPHLLTVNIAADAVFLNEPLVLPGPESNAAVASELVMNVLQIHCRPILRRKIVLEAVLTEYRDNASIFSQHEALHAALLKNNEELHKVMRRIAKDIDNVRTDASNTNKIYERSEGFEHELMAGEDLAAQRLQKEGMESRIEALLGATRRRLQAFSPMDWHGFAAPYGGKHLPAKPYLELMRGIMVAIKFTPPKPARGDKHGKHKSSSSSAAAASAGGGDGGGTSGKMDDETVAKCATNLLAKFADFVEQLNAVDPAALPSTHTQALRMMNLMLNSAHIAELDGSKRSPLYRMQYMEKRYVLQETPEVNIVFAVLKKYLLLLDIAAATYVVTTQSQERINVLASARQQRTEENVAAKQALANSLKEKSNSLNDLMLQVDSVLVRNRMKIGALEKFRAQRKHVLQAVRQSKQYVQSELRQMKDVLRFVVTDICVAATVLVRAAWLPEQIRQECMEQLRNSLISHEVRVSDTPFLLGHLTDRLQLRQWTNQDELSGLPRDPASINTMSLCYLSPRFTLVVDPDGTAPAVLSADPLVGYDTYSVTAQKFTLALFMNWIHTSHTTVSAVSHGTVSGGMGSTVESDTSVSRGGEANTTSATNGGGGGGGGGGGEGSEGLTIVITDLQAGVSDDLISFLSSDIVSNEQIYAASVSNNDISGSGGGVADAATQGVSFVLNPSIDFLSATSRHHHHHHNRHHSSSSTSGRHQRLPPEQPSHQQVQEAASSDGTLIDERAGGRAESSATTTTVGTTNPTVRRLDLPCKLRVYLVSSKAPAMDEFGISRPLPSSCLKNMTVVHWGVHTSCPSSAYVEAKPVAQASEQQYVSDNTLAARLGGTLCQRISPGHFPFQALVNQILVADTTQLYEVEDQLVGYVYAGICIRDVPSATAASSSSSTTTLPDRGGGGGGGGNFGEDLCIEGLVTQKNVRLGLLDDDKALKLILDTAHARDLYRIDIEMNKSLQRELTTFLGTTTEVFSMCVDFLRMCSTFLPPEVVTPYALTSQALCNVFLKPTLRLADKKHFFRGLPPSLADMLRVTTAVTHMQRRLRNIHPTSKSNSSSSGGGGEDKQPKETGSVAAITAAVAVNRDSVDQRTAAQANAHDSRVAAGGTASSNHTKSSHHHHHHHHHSGSSNLDGIHKRFGLLRSQREKAAQDFSYLLLPLRTFFLREIVNYVTLCIRPGLEWLPKLLLLFTTWSQSEALPSEEIRTLIHFIMQSSGQMSPRYAHFIAFNSESEEKGDLSRELQSLLRYKRQSTTSTRVSSMRSRGRSTGGGGGDAASSLVYSPLGSPTTGLTRSRSRARSSSGDSAFSAGNDSSSSVDEFDTSSAAVTGFASSPVMSPSGSGSGTGSGSQQRSAKKTRSKDAWEDDCKDGNGDSERGGEVDEEGVVSDGDEDGYDEFVSRLPTSGKMSTRVTAFRISEESNEPQSPPQRRASAVRWQDELSEGTLPPGESPQRPSFDASGTKTSSHSAASAGDRTTQFDQQQQQQAASQGGTGNGGNSGNSGSTTTTTTTINKTAASSGQLLGAVSRERLQLEMSWLDRGLGLIDGLWLNKRSTRWRVNPLESVYFGQSNIPAQLHRGRYLMLDTYGGTHIGWKNKLFKPSSRQGDPFEVEWLRTKGVRLFAATGLAATVALGASVGKTLEDLPSPARLTASATAPSMTATTAAAMNPSIGAAVAKRPPALAGAVHVNSGTAGSGPGGGGSQGGGRRRSSVRTAAAAAGTTTGRRRSSVASNATTSTTTSSNSSLDQPHHNHHQARKASFTTRNARLSIVAANMSAGSVSSDLLRLQEQQQQQQQQQGEELNSTRTTEGGQEQEGTTAATASSSPQPSPSAFSATAVALRDVTSMAELNVAARTMSSGRVSSALAGLTSGLGSHRNSIVAPNSSGSVGIGGSSSSSSDIRRISQRRVSTLEVRHQQRRSSSINANDTALLEHADEQEGGGEEEEDKQNDTIHENIDGSGSGVEDLSDLLSGSMAYQNMLMLETHPELGGIFKGMAAGITRNINDFADWRTALNALTSVDPATLSAKDLGVLLFTVKPPVFDDVEDENQVQSGSDEGLWLKGYELTILQSLLLSEAIIPGASGALVEVLFALVAHYLRQDRHIVLHPDEEVFDEDDEEYDDESDSEGEGDWEDEDDEEDEFDADSQAISRHASNVRASIFSSSSSARSRGNSTATISSSSSGTTNTGSKNSIGGAPPAIASLGARSTFFRSLERFRRLSRVTFQEGVPLINSWDKLERILNGESNDRGPQLKAEEPSSSSATVVSLLSDREHQLLPSSISNRMLARANASSSSATSAAGGTKESRKEEEKVAEHTVTAGESRLTCRDFENWESVLLNVLTEPAGMEKFVFMKELRDATLGVKSSVFLSSHLHNAQIAVFSQRARDLGVHNYDHISVINCNTHTRLREGSSIITARSTGGASSVFEAAGSGTAISATGASGNTTNSSSSSSGGGVGSGSGGGGGGSSSHSRTSYNMLQRAERMHLTDTIRSIRQAVSLQRSKRAIVEMLSLQSPYGNAIISSVLLHATHAVGGAVRKWQDTTHLQQSLEVEGAVINTRVHMNQIAAAAAAGDGGGSSSQEFGAAFRINKFERKPWQSNFPLIISSEWGRHDVSGVGPFMTMSDLNYTWLPRFFCPDVIRATSAAGIVSPKINYNNGASGSARSGASNGNDNNNNNNNNNNVFGRFTGLPPSLSESAGILCEELESCLLWVLNANKSIAKSNVTVEIRHQLRRATRVELRVTSALLGMWQLVQYVRCLHREARGLPARWSACLNPLSLWQLIRLMIKTSEILASSCWTNEVGKGDIPALLKNERFSKAMWLLSESFSSTDCDIYALTTQIAQRGGSTTQSQIKPSTATQQPRLGAAAASKGSPTGNRASVLMKTPIKPPSSNKAFVPQVSGVGGGGSGGGGGAGKSRATYIQQLMTVVKANKASNGGLTGTSASGSGSASGASSVGNGRGGMRLSTRRSASPSLLLPNATVGGSGSSSGSSSSSSVVMESKSLRQKKIQRRAMRLAEEARLQYVQTLCSFDKFSLQYAQQQEHEGVYHANTTSSQSNNTAATATSGVTLESELMERFVSLIGVYFAHVLVAEHRKDGNIADSTARATKHIDMFTKAAQDTMQSRRQTTNNKLNLKSFLEQDSLSAVNAFESWPDISPEGADVTLGSLSSTDVVKCLVKWTFNGDESVAPSASISGSTAGGGGGGGTVAQKRWVQNKKRIMQSLKRLSVLVRDGKLEI